MRNFAPQTRMGWLCFILFSAKVYIVLTPIILLLAGGLGGLDFRWDTYTRNLILWLVGAYIACIIILVVGAGIATFARHWKVMWIALTYAIIGFLLLGMLLPCMAPCK